jgi:hypothetical protein
MKTFLALALVSGTSATKVCTHTTCSFVQLPHKIGEKSVTVMRVHHDNEESVCSRNESAGVSELDGTQQWINHGAQAHCAAVTDKQSPDYMKCECHQIGYHPNGVPGTGSFPSGDISVSKAEYDTMTASDRPVTPAYNTGNDCGADPDACAKRKCYHVSVAGPSASTPLYYELQNSQANWNVQKVSDWRALRPSNAADSSMHPSGVTESPRMTPDSTGVYVSGEQQRLLLSFKDPNDGSGNTFLRSCDYMYGRPEWGKMGRFFLKAVCPQTSDEWAAETCSARPATGASDFIGFLWADKTLRTGPKKELKDRATWTMYEVSPGVYKAKNVWRQMWIGLKHGNFELVQDASSAAALKFDEVAAPAGVVQTPVEQTSGDCCTGNSCDCAISKARPAYERAGRDYDSSSKTRNDSEETTDSWTWNNALQDWESAPGLHAVTESYGGTTEQWWQGAGSLSGSSSTVELGYSYDCRFLYNADDDKCYLADRTTPTETQGVDSDLMLLKTAGLRFTGLSVPKGATITKAHLRFTARKSDDKRVDLVIRGEQTSGGSFPQVSDPLRGDYTENLDYSGELKWQPTSPNRLEEAFAASSYPEVKWANVEAWSTSNEYSSPDISSIVQKMVDDNEFTDVMTFFVKVDPAGSTKVGARRRPASFKKGAPAKLMLEWN